MAEKRDHEGLQVVDRSNAPQFVPHSDKEPVVARNQFVAGEKNAVGYRYIPQEANEPDPVQSRWQRFYCGLGRTRCGILLAVVVAVLVGVAIGGGVAGALIDKPKKLGFSASVTPSTSIAYSTGVTSRSTASSSNSLTRPTTSSTPASSMSSTSATRATSSTLSAPSSATSIPASGMGSYDCPSSNYTTYTPEIAPSYTFRKLCDVDWPSGVTAIDGVGEVVDLRAVIAYSLDSCIDQCAGLIVAGISCTAVAYGANITLALSRGGITGNCFLKNERGLYNLLDTSGQEASAYLL